MTLQQRGSGPLAWAKRCLCIPVFVVALGVLSVPHELGHFLLCKAADIWVQRFTIFLGEPLVAVQLGETEFCIGRYPVGAANVVFEQRLRPEFEEEVERALFYDPERFLAEVRKHNPDEALAFAYYDRWYAHAPAWERFMIVLFGPLFGIMFGGILSVAATFMQVKAASQGVKLADLRPFSHSEPGDVFIDSLLLPWHLLRGKVGWQNVAGPLGILRASTLLLEGSLRERLMFLAALSVGFSYFNLLPIVPLDGGRLVLLVAECVTGQPDSALAQHLARNGTMYLLALIGLFTVIDLRNAVEARLAARAR